VKKINTEQRLKKPLRIAYSTATSIKGWQLDFIYHYRQMKAEKEAATQKWLRNHLLALCTKIRNT